MEEIIIFSALLIINIICAMRQKKDENYYTAIFCGFVAGICLMALLFFIKKY